MAAEQKAPEETKLSEEKRVLGEGKALSDLNISDMPGLSVECGCGRFHSVGIKRIILGPAVKDSIPEVISEFHGSSIFMIADTNTYQALGEGLERYLSGIGFSLKTYVFKGASPLVPDEKAVGRLLMEMEPGISAILAVGSGSINDLARFLSSRLGIPYIIAGTAPSMDGYASVVSPLILNGFKTTFQGGYPYAIIADTEVMRKAPMDMIHAGFGDVIGKFTALSDWNLARLVNGEYYCENVVKLVETAVGKCADNAEKIASRDEQGIRYLIEALIMTGVAMGLVGCSRPASGAEHHLAHFWEMEALRKGEEHPLHGNSVGAAAVAIAHVYELSSGFLPEGAACPKPAHIRNTLERAGSAASPRELGIEREAFRYSLLHAMEIRDRFTILRYAASKGKLEEIAGIVTGRFYD